MQLCTYVRNVLFTCKIKHAVIMIQTDLFLDTTRELTYHMDTVMMNSLSQQSPWHFFGIAQLKFALSHFLSRHNDFFNSWK